MPTSGAELPFVLARYGERGDCGDKWFYFKSRCYRFYDEVQYFPTAVHTCRSFGAEIASIRSSEENSYLSHLLQNFRHEDGAWIGLSRPDHGNFAWSDGSPVTYSNWLYDRPNDSGLCAQMIAGGEWDNLQCYSRLKFVCEKVVNPPTRLDPALSLLIKLGIPVMCVVMMLCVVAFLYYRSHRELEEIKRQQGGSESEGSYLKEAMALPLSQRPPLHRSKKKYQWKGAFEFMSGKDSTPLDTFALASSSQNLSLDSEKVDEIHLSVVENRYRQADELPVGKEGETELKTWVSKSMFDGGESEQSSSSVLENSHRTPSTRQSDSFSPGFNLDIPKVALCSTRSWPLTIRSDNYLPSSFGRRFSQSSFQGSGEVSIREGQTLKNSRDRWLESLRAISCSPELASNAVRSQADLSNQVEVCSPCQRCASISQAPTVSGLGKATGVGNKVGAYYLTSGTDEPIISGSRTAKHLNATNFLDLPCVSVSSGRGGPLMVPRIVEPTNADESLAPCQSNFDSDSIPKSAVLPSQGSSELRVDGLSYGPSELQRTWTGTKLRWASRPVSTKNTTDIAPYTIVTLV